MASKATQHSILRQLLRSSCQHELKSFSHPIRQCTRPVSKPCLSQIQSLTPYRTFTSTSSLSKKGGKEKRSKGKGKEKEESFDEDEDDGSSSTQAVVDDPFDFSVMEDSIAETMDKLKKALAQVPSGGRFDTEALEGLKVEVDKVKKIKVKLGELGQIVVKGGRTVVVVVGEEDYIKPITSTIQSANMSLQPQPDPHNPLQLIIPIPPPTAESRKKATQLVDKAGDTANHSIKNARAAMQKKLRAMELKKSVRPDDLNKAHKEMEKVVKAAVDDVKGVVEGAKKGV